MSTSPDQIALTPSQRELLARIADDTGRPWTEVLADALSTLPTNAQVDAPSGESVYDALARLGLLGCINGAPSDLSTNPDHMKDFGASEG